VRYPESHFLVMVREFPDRSQILFGREPDLAYLLGRSEHSGITAVIGRAQMGKSWLLTELARRLSYGAGPVGSPAIHFQTLLDRPCYLAGFAESLGETADLLLRAVVDLYSRWLSDASNWEQAQVVYEQQKKDFVGRAGEAVGGLFEKLSKLGGKPLEAAGGLVKQTFEALASANRELLSGGIQLPRLQIEQGRELLELVHKITKRRIVLVFDQWEKSPGLEMETNILDGFARHIDDWPPCHIFVGARPDEKPRKAVHQLRKGFPGTVEVYELPPMHLDANASGTALLQHLREEVSAAQAASDEALLEMISGYPGTIAQWTSSYNARRLQSVQELKEVADDANAYRFARLFIRTRADKNVTGWPVSNVSRKAVQDIRLHLQTRRLFPLIEHQDERRLHGMQDIALGQPLRRRELSPIVSHRQG
jgi:hypothetical protein